MQKLLALLGAKSKEEFVALLAQFIKFGLVGVSNTAVSMAVYYIFLWISPDLYMVGSVLGTILSIANAFFWNDKFVFTGNANDWRSKLKRLGKTYVSYGGTSILSNVLLWIEVTFFSVNKTIAPIVNLLVTIPRKREQSVLEKNGQAVLCTQRSVCHCGYGNAVCYPW